MWEPLVNQSQTSRLILTLEINSFRPLRYAVPASAIIVKNFENQLREIFLILLDLKFTRVWTFYYQKTAPA